MSVSGVDSRIFRNIFGTDEIRKVFNDEAYARCMTETETALARAQSKLDVIPKEAGSAITAACDATKIDYERLERETEIVGYPVLPLIRQLNEMCPPEFAKYIHWGATTQDIMDDAYVLQIRSGLKIVGRELNALAEVLSKMSKKYRDTPMAGRTHLQHALPVTFGFKCAVWLSAIQRHLERLKEIEARCLLVQFGGAAGTLASLGEDDTGIQVRKQLAEELDLKDAPITWHVVRDNIAEVINFLALIGGVLGKIGLDLEIMCSNEIGEVAEPFVPHRGRMAPSTFAVAVVLLDLASLAWAQGRDGHNDMNVSGMRTAGAIGDAAGEKVDEYNMPSYAGLSMHRNMVLAHIISMVLAWFLVLPIGVVSSIVRSNLALLVQSLFLILNGLGVLFGTIYNINTPNLYVNNAHHKIGWIATWVMIAQFIMTLLFSCSRTGRQPAIRADGRAAFLPMSVVNIAQQNIRLCTNYCCSCVSGRGSERTSTLTSLCDISPNGSRRRDTLDGFERPEAEPEENEDDELAASPLQSPSGSRPGWVRISLMDKYMSAKVLRLLSTKILRTVEVMHEVTDRIILVLGFIAWTTGGVTYAGIFRGDHVFNGLAHFIKGGIFFWYGLLTLGRWMGCFADLGWAWNIKPTRSEVGRKKAAIPSAEFVESFVIWLYGALNMWLEHFAAWGSEWTAQDLEHVSIAIMFFGGGLCGMLVESQFVRYSLNTIVDNMPARAGIHPSEAHKLRSHPKQYDASLNPVPALMILLLGIMMSSHHQSSMVSTRLHAQWGNLLVGFSLARIATYVLMYISPPTSVYASRPPTELVSSFCLISGGLILMASTKDIVHYMERSDLLAMSTFTVTMGITAFVMAYEVIVLAFKGWAARKKLRLAQNQNST